jgi:hypothetical protein
MTPDEAERSRRHIGAIHQANSLTRQDVRKIMPIEDFNNIVENFGAESDISIVETH